MPMFIFPSGSEGPCLSWEQAMGLAVVKEVLDSDDKFEGWHMCDNGCCVMAHEKGVDNMCFRIARSGQIDIIDNTGQVLLSLSAEDDVTLI